MDFGLSEEQQLLQETIGQFLANENDPNQLRARFDAEDAFDEGLWKGMMELGIGGLLVPDEFGGAGVDMVDAAIVSEQMGFGAAPGPFLGHTLAGLAIALGGSDDQKKTWLPKLATGDALATVAFGEEGGSWQPDQWSPSGDRLTGKKVYVPYAAQADLIVVGTAGGGLALVEPGDGTTIELFDNVDRSRRLYTVTFDGAAASALPSGADVSGQVRDAALILLAADAFGGASRLVEMSVEYAKTREQFGVTIGHFQALKHQLANMALDTEPSRALFWYAAHAYDAVPEDREKMAALAKSHITDRFMQVSRDATEAHGGIGYTWECDVQMWFKRAMFDRIWMGSPSSHRERVAQLSAW